MTKAMQAALLPLVWLGSLLRLLLGPAVVVALGWWLLPTGSLWLVGLVAVVGCYVLVALVAWGTQARGQLRSLARGELRVSVRREREGE
ncbi:hypothetical protein [Actinokineospora globicatena]|uniref:Uncharacterized protein n=1 Tax=Actinokineospora globicatena TaxID=103729 RepID=A0A9W6VDM4_9PSEU|nr:hypothetical protein [Actinokineospora globicatena]GLW95436.1 hypothetical protein Aglo03_62520 [Actinokineospora globicatena]